jgi:hypothetical protein
MTKAVKEFFKAAEQRLLAMEPGDRRQVINLLSALRGPDSNNVSTKHKAYTGLVRQSLFPGLNEYPDDSDYFEGRDGVPWSSHVAGLPKHDNGEAKSGHVVENMLLSDGADYHFACHIGYAIDALIAEDKAPESEEAK